MGDEVISGFAPDFSALQLFYCINYMTCQKGVPTYDKLCRRNYIRNCTGIFRNAVGLLINLYSPDERRCIMSES